MKLQAEQATLSRDFATAYADYQQILAMVEDHGVTDPLIADLISSAQTNQDALLHAMSSKEQAALRIGPMPKSDAVAAIDRLPTTLPSTDLPISAAAIATIQPVQTREPLAAPTIAATVNEAPASKSSPPSIWQQYFSSQRSHPQSSLASASDEDSSSAIANFSLLPSLFPRTGKTSLADFSSLWMTAGKPYLPGTLFGLPTTCPPKVTIDISNAGPAMLSDKH